MEYTFKNSKGGRSQKLLLKDSHLEIIQGGNNNVPIKISYKRIHSVWLNKPGGFCTPNEYSCTLNIEDDKPIYISSRNFSAEGKEIGQMNHYNSFIRVLHLHLQSKTKARYGFGIEPKKYFLRITAIITILFVCTLAFFYLNFNQYLIFLLGGVGTFVGFCGLNFCVKNYPSSYRPDNIPLSVLPANNR